MSSLTTPIHVTDEMFELARSIHERRSARATLARVTGNRSIADYIVDMTILNISIQQILARMMGAGAVADADLSMTLTFLCGVSRIWNECVTAQDSSLLPFALLEAAGFAALVFSTRSLARILPLPEGVKINRFLMRIDGTDVRFSAGIWLQYVLAQRPTSADICNILLDNPHDGLVEYIAQLCTLQKIVIMVEYGDTVYRLVYACIRQGRRRRRCGVYVESRREKALVKVVCHLVDAHAHTAFIVRDVIVSDVLRRSHLDFVNMKALGMLTHAVQRRLPYLPMPLGTFTLVSEEVRRESPTWASILEREGRAVEECVDHPEWVVRRHY